jgi:hypothetical protein
MSSTVDEGKTDSTAVREKYFDERVRFYELRPGSLLRKELLGRRPVAAASTTACRANIRL